MKKERSENRSFLLPNNQAERLKAVSNFHMIKVVDWTGKA
jgi:hypothetical protein